MDREEPLSILTSWGVIRLVLLDGEPVRCRLPLLREIPRAPFAVLESGHDPFSRYVRALLEGGNPARPPIGNPDGTAFQQTVWKGLLNIPHGETLSYSGLARSIGRRAACRAVANACGANPLPLFIPCHRVLRSDGSLGGFSAGLAWKRLLLGVEQLGC